MITALLSTVLVLFARDVLAQASVGAAAPSWSLQRRDDRPTLIFEVGTGAKIRDMIIEYWDSDGKAVQRKVDRAFPSEQDYELHLPPMEADAKVKGKEGETGMTRKRFDFTADMGDANFFKVSR